MTGIKTTEVLQPLLLFGGEIKDSRKFLPADIERAREDGVRCPVCRQEGRILLAPEGPLLSHEALHEAETPLRREARGLLGRWLHGALPDAQVRQLLPWNDTFLDVGVVRSDGARLALRFISEDTERGEIEALRESLRAERTVLLLLLDADRLPPKAFRPGAQVVGAQFRRAESDMLRQGDPLLFFDAPTRSLLLLEPPEEALPLLREPRNLGSCKGVVRHYRLSELHLRRGRWWLDRRFDDDPLLRPEPNRTILQRLRGLEESASLQEQDLHEEDKDLSS